MAWVFGATETSGTLFATFLLLLLRGWALDLPLGGIGSDFFLPGAGVELEISLKGAPVMPGELVGGMLRDFFDLGNGRTLGGGKVVIRSEVGGGCESGSMLVAVSGRVGNGNSRFGGNIWVKVRGAVEGRWGSVCLPKYRGRTDRASAGRAVNSGLGSNTEDLLERVRDAISSPSTVEDEMGWSEKTPRILDSAALTGRWREWLSLVIRSDPKKLVDEDGRSASTGRHKE